MIDNETINKQCILRKIIDPQYTSANGFAIVKPSWDEQQVAQCPLCQGLTFIDDKDEKGYRLARRCPGRTRLDNFNKFNRAKVPARFCDATFDNFDLQKVNNGSTVKSLMEGIKTLGAMKNADNKKRPQFGYLLEGGPGVGKTHLLCAAIRYITTECGIPCLYVDYSTLLSDIRASYNQSSQGLSESDFIMPLANIPFLFLDELGKGREKANDFELRIIDEIINRRYLNTELVTFFATNYLDRDTSGFNKYVRRGYDLSLRPPASMNTETWKEQEKDLRESESFGGNMNQFREYVAAIMQREHLEDRISERTASRIVVMAKTLKIEAPDYRRTELQNFS